MSADLDVLKDIPGYKAILKSVIKTQIQLLVEQLSDHTGEESIILTASVNDGSLSHLGSCTGKGFLEGRDEIKSQFLGYCLKSHHRKKSQETPYERNSGPPPRSSASLSGPRMPVQQSPAKRPRVHPVSMSRAVAHGSPLPISDQTFNTNSNIPVPQIPRAEIIGNIDTGGNANIKVEVPSVSRTDEHSFSDNASITPASLSSTLQLSHTQTSADSSENTIHKNDPNRSNVASVSEEAKSNGGADSGIIKIEPITESEMELEITGVELGDSHIPIDNWGQGSDILPGTQMLYETAGAEGGANLESADQSSYSKNNTNRLANLASFHATQFDTLSGEKNVFSNMKTKQQVEAHQRYEGDQRYYVCPFCGKESCEKGNMDRHILQHTGDKPYSCGICQKQFTRNANLMSHQTRAHIGQQM